MSHQKCQCVNCSVERVLKGAENIKHIQTENWDGKGLKDVMLCAANQMPVCVARIEIIGIPLLVEPWMLQKVLTHASQELAKYVLDAEVEKVVN